MTNVVKSSVNKGGRPKGSTTKVVSLAEIRKKMRDRDLVNLAMDALFETITKGSTRDKIKAAEIILNYYYGRPHQTLEVESNVTSGISERMAKAKESLGIPPVVIEEGK